MTNEELVTMYQETGKREALGEICKQNERLIFMILRDFRSIYKTESANSAAVIESADLKQDGFIGLIQAVKNYDPGRGAAFSSVAVMYIRGAILRGLSDRGCAIRIPENRREQLNRIKSFRAAYLAEYGRNPQIDEISAFLGVSGQDVVELLKIEIRANIASLNCKSSDDPDGDELCDTIPDSKNPIEEVEESIYRDQVKEKLWGEVDKLEANQAAILHGYYQENKTLKEIGESMSIPQKKAATLKEKALRRLRSGASGRELRELASEYMRADSASYTGVGVGSFLRTGMSATERAAIIRMNALAHVKSNIMQRERLIEGGLSRSEREQYFDMLCREKRKAEQERMDKLKAEL